MRADLVTRGLRARTVLSVLAALVIAVAVAPAARAGAPSFTARGSAEQVYVTGLAAGRADVAAARRTARRSTTQQRRLARRAAVPQRDAGQRATGCACCPTAPSPVRSPSTPTPPRRGIPAIYNQSIPDNGYTYLTTRDGTQLAIDVHPPTSPAGEPGVPAGADARAAAGLPALPRPARRCHGRATLPPYPTLIEYSGYGYADPAGPVNGIAVLANLMGFAVVDVNMRGTGCSGGAYRLLRAAAEPRRLRRDRDDRPPAVGARPQGRDDGHLLRRASASCSPRSSTRPTSRRSRRCRRSTPPPRRCTRAASSTPASRSRGPSERQQDAEPRRSATAASPRPTQQIQNGDHDLQGQPGAARRGRRT